VSWTPKASEVLSSPEVDAVVEMLLYHARPEVRQALMVHCPVAYLKLCGGHPSVREAILNAVSKAMDERKTP
jgi:hypothetical protein